MFGILATTPSAHAQFTGTVCLVTPGTTSCPSSPASLTGNQGTQLQVSVFIQNSDGFNGFDITLLADRTILKPAGVSLTGSVLPGPQTILVECLGGILVQGSTCSTTDTPNTLHLAAVECLGCPLTPTPTTGLLFTAIYNITGTTSGIPLGFQTGCTPPTSVPNNNTCVTLANGGITPIPETVQTAVFNNAPPPPPDFSLSVSPTTLTIPKGSSGIATITITSLNGFSGIVSGTATISPLLKSGPSFPRSFSTSLSSGGTATWGMTINTSKTTHAGTYTITATLTSGSISHQITYTIIVAH